jgi:hypothetical protein
MIDFFEFTDKGLEIKDESFLIYEPYNRLWKRDKSLDKDVAKEELKYIFFLCDYRSRGIIQGYKGVDLILYARQHTKLPKDWEEDKVIRDCMLLYLNENDGIKTKVFKSLVNSLSTTNRAVITLDDRLDDIITRFENLSAEEDNINVADAVKAIQAAVEAIIRYSTEVPKKLNDLDNAMRQAQKEQSQKHEGRSGIVISDTMLPKRRHLK